MTENIRKAVVLAAGRGTRMQSGDADAELTAGQRRAAEAGMKALLPVGDRPFLDHVLAGLADAGYDAVCLVVGPGHREIRRRYTADCAPDRFRLDFAVQREPRGTADAVHAAASWVAGDEFLVLNADNLYPPESLRALRTLGEPGTVLYRAGDLTRLGNIPPERVGAFAMCHADERGYLQSIVEKPGRTVTGEALISMNLWRLSPEFLRACREVEPSERGELELPRAVQHALDRGMRLRALHGEGCVLDLSRRSDIAAVAARLAAQEPML